MPTVQTNDVETYYERRGEGPPLVFVHAAIMDHRMWEPQVAALRDAYETITYDVRGHGLTGGSDRDPYSVDLFAADLAALLSALDVERPVLCGLSTGGCIAQAYAARFPERVSGLVLASTFTAGPLGPSGRFLFATLRLFAVLDRVVGYKRLNRLQLWVGNRLKPGMAGDRVTVQRLVDEGPKIPHDEFAKIVGAVVGFPEADLDLSRIAVPALVLYGEHEPALTRRHARLLGAEIPNASVREIPGAGHASNLDNPEFFTAAVREFVAETVCRPGD